MQISVLAPVLVTVLTFSILAKADDQQIELTTPRGKVVKVDIYSPSLPKAIVLAPGQGCNPRLDLYDELAREAKKSNRTRVRLYRAYCVADSQNGQPSDNLSAEKEDLSTVLSHVKDKMGYSDADVAIGGKSLGSLVSFKIFQDQKSRPELLLLTPLCTQSPKPEIRKSVFASYYPGLASETRTVLMVLGSADPLCDTSHFHQFLKNKTNNLIPLVTPGDHSLGIQNADGKYNVELGRKSLQATSKWIFTWLK